MRKNSRGGYYPPAIGKRLSCLLLALSMLTVFMPIIASAETGTKYGDYLYYKINEDGTQVTITDCDTTATEIEIPAEISGLPVTDIGMFAFLNCNSLKSAVIPNNVTFISAFAFQNCSSLTSVTIPDSVTTIGISAFQNCSSLTNITIPNGVTLIGDSAFQECNSLTSVDIGNNVATISLMAFYGCKSLTNITIPNSVTSIEYDAFKDTAYYNNIYNWKNGLLYIGDYLIEANTHVVKGAYLIKNETRGIADGAFFDCTDLTSITLPDSVTFIGTSSFDGCNSLTNVTIPIGVTFIGSWAFSSCNNLTDVYYGGKKEQWENICNEEYNEAFMNATIHYNSGTPKPDEPTPSPTPNNPDIVDTTPDTYEVSEITQTGTGVKFIVTTKELVSGKQTVMVACYDENGVFTGLKQQDITAEDTSQEISVEIDKTNAKTVKAFIWNGLEYMMPASNIQSLEL